MLETLKITPRDFLHFGSDPITFEQGEWRTREVIDDALSRACMSRDDFDWPDITLREGDRLVIPADRERLGGSLRTFFTNDFDVIKRCVGFDDQEARRVSDSAHRMPSRQLLDPSRVSDPRTLDAAQLHELEIAANAYLYRDAAAVRDFKPLVEAYYGSVEISVAAIGRLVLSEGASLTLQTFPTILIVEELIFEGGSINVHAKSRIHAGRVEKKEEKVS